MGLIDTPPLRMKYFILNKVYTDESAIKYLYHSLTVCTLKRVDYHLVSADKPCISITEIMIPTCEGGAVTASRHISLLIAQKLHLNNQ